MRKPASAPTRQMHSTPTTGVVVPAGGAHAQHRRGDGDNPRGQTVETIDKVDADRHPHDPEHRQRPGGQAKRQLPGVGELDLFDADARSAQGRGGGQQRDQLVAGGKIEHIVGQPDEGDKQRRTEQRGQTAVVKNIVQPDDVGKKQERDEHDEHRRRNGDAADPGGRQRVHFSDVGQVDNPPASRQTSDKRRENRRRDEGSEKADGIGGQFAHKNPLYDLRQSLIEERACMRAHSVPVGAPIRFIMTPICR